MIYNISFKKLSFGYLYNRDVSVNTFGGINEVFTSIVSMGLSPAMIETIEVFDTSNNDYVTVYSH